MNQEVSTSESSKALVVPDSSLGTTYNSIDHPADGDHDGSETDIISYDGSTLKTSVSQTYIHLLKGYLGPGCLSLPWAISQLGFLWGVVAIAVMSTWSSYNCLTIVKIKRYIERVNRHNITVNETESNSQSSSVASSALTYPNVGEWFFGESFERYVTVCICTQQLAICTVFFSFIGENIYAIFDLVPPGVIPAALDSHIGVMSIALPFIMGLSFIPNLSALTPIMAAGTVLLFAGFAVLAYIIVLVWDERPTEPIEIQWKSAPLALCAILYSYEGICLILPIESSMAEPRKFKKVFSYAMASVAFILAAVSNICVYAFGSVSNGSITAFLLETYADNYTVTVLVMIANAAVSLSVLLTYPIQLFPVLEILDSDFRSFCAKLWGGKEMEEDDDEHDLSGFEPMPPLPEHDIADHDTEFDNFKETLDDGSVREEPKKEEEGDEAIPQESDLRSSYMSNITEVIQWSSRGSNLTLRILLVVLTYTVASVVPNVQALISLAGAIAGSSSALLIPPMLELGLIKHLEVTSKDDDLSSVATLSAQQPDFMWALLWHNLSGKHWKKKLKCYILFWLGFMFFLIGAYASFANIVVLLMGKQ